ncbi:hypothetical protein GCM10022393_32240 [Aquimarina addita]|uniref:Short-chain dehydrogenase n=1 Tax=Aquimarina addita TaxID=870485 RepID=A0ABP6UNZ4_9FLAO
MKINLIIIIAIIFSITTSCSEETDEALLEKDRKELIEILDTQKVLIYKFGKVCIRASVVNDTVSPELKAFRSKMKKVFSTIVHHDPDESLSVLEYLSIYRDYRDMSKFIQKTDEDQFPTLSEAIRTVYGVNNTSLEPYPELENAVKIYIQNLEHAFLSTILVSSRDMGKELALYECSKTYPELLPDQESKPLIRFFRGFLFFEKGLRYLSEDEISKNISWLEKHPEVALPLVKKMFQWGTFDNTQTHIGFHGINHLFRGLDRLTMEREIDEQRALDDFEIFIKDTKKLGLQNEAIWAIETFLYLKKEDNEKAIVALSKLKTSPLLSLDEKKGIEESIKYLEDRRPDKVLNGFYDKYFLTKIASKYIFSILSKINWEKIMKDQNVPHTEEIFGSIDAFDEFMKNMDTYTSGDAIKETGKELQKEGTKLWEKAKDVIK